MGNVVKQIKMSDSNKTKWSWVVLAMFMLLIFPIILNWLILRPAIVEVVGDGTDWLGFWAAYIGAIASFAMVVLTWWTLKQSKIQNDALIAQNEEILRNNREQLDELKRQWDELNRPNICVNVVVYSTAFYIQISNVGNTDAHNVCLSFNDEFISNIKPDIQPFFKKEHDSPFFVERGNKRYLFIGWCKEINDAWREKDFSIIVKGTYNDIYSINRTIPITEFVDKGFFVVHSETDRLLEHIKKGTVVQNDQYYPIQKSLDIIAKNIVSLDKSRKESDEDKN